MTDFVAKIIDDLNTPENYRPILSASAMAPGVFYKCLSMSIRSTMFGKRVALIIIGGDEEKILFLSPSYLNDKKQSDLAKLFAIKGKSVFVSNEGMRNIEETGGKLIPMYKFKVE